MGTKRPVNSGRKSITGATIRVSDKTTASAADAPPPPGAPVRFRSLTDLTPTEQRDPIGTAHIATSNDSEVSATIGHGMPGFQLVGANGDTQRAVRDRVRAAILSTGFNWPNSTVTVTVTANRADSRYDSNQDAAVAVAVLQASGQVEPVNQSVRGELGLDGSIQHRMEPHPDYNYDTAWTSPAIRADIEALPEGNVAELVAGMSDVFDRHGYDSIDRELAMWYWSQRTGRDYNDFYDAWLDS